MSSDNKFMRKIINHKEDLIQKLKEQRKYKRITTTLFDIKALVNKIEMIRQLKRC